jgi:hypothetical protein
LQINFQENEIRIKHIHLIQTFISAGGLLDVDEREAIHE